MPDRPRNHEIETEPRRAFERSVPSSCVVRPVDSDDYGIDREVEIFDNGKTTGLTFKVQLKGTDKSGDSVRAKRSTVDYWRELDVPVLVVSYSAATGRMRGRWAHTIGVDVTESGAEKVTIKMDPAFDLTDGWTDGLADDLRLVRDLRRGAVPNPLPIDVLVDQGLKYPKAQLGAEILRLSRNSGWPMRPAKPDEHALRLEVGAEHARAALPLLWGSANWRLPAGWTDDYTLREIAQFMLLLAASTHVNVNEKTAVELAVAAGHDSVFWLVEDIVRRLGPLLAEHGQHQLLFDIIHSLSSTQSPDAAGVLEWYQVMLRDSLSKIDDATFAQFSRRRRDYIAQIAGDKPTEAGRQLFNLANLHRTHRRDFETAIELYGETAQFAPRYQNDPLTLAHVGGCLWENGQYQASADAYREALANGHPHQDLGPLLADSLMLAGKYKQAADELATWTPAGEERDRVGIIRIAILDFLAIEVGLDEQDRTAADPEQHIAKVEELFEAGGTAELLELLKTEDALSPSVWTTRIDAEDPDTSLLPALIVATVLERLTPMWVIALLTGLAAGAAPELLTAICNQARLLCEDDFYDAVSQVADAQDDPERADQLRALIATTYSTDPVTHGHTIRYVTGGGKGDWVIRQEWLGKPGAVPPSTGATMR